MNTITLNEVFEKGAWSNVSSRMPISMDMLEKHADRFDWREISRNHLIKWTKEALQKFADRIDWEEFSENCPEHLICDSFLQQFGDRLNWEKLSGFMNVGDLDFIFDLLEKHADRFDWREISRNHLIKWTKEALQKFADRLDWDEISDNCWNFLDVLILQQFGDRWNLANLSRHMSKDNKDLYEKFLDLLEKYADRVDWHELIRHNNVIDTQNFERFRPYIPISELLNVPYFWKPMIDERAEAIWIEIGGEDIEAFCADESVYDAIEHLSKLRWRLNG